MNSHPPPPPPPYRDTTDTIDTTHDMLNIMRSLIYSYNENIQHHNRIIETYNENIRTVLTLLTVFMNRHSNPSYSEYNTHNTFNSRNYRNYRYTRSPSRRNYLTQNDLSSLIYLLNIPLSLRTTGGSTERRQPILLTNEQIINGTRIIQYTEDLGERRCPISYEDFVPNEEICQIRGCRHIFKTAHIMRWFESHNACPICRYDLRQYREPVESDTTNNPIPPPPPPPPTETTDIHDIDTPQPSSIDTNLRRNISISEFLPILENILDTNNTEIEAETNHSFRPRTGDARPATSTSIFSEETTNLLNNRFSQILSDIIMEQIPTTDMSNNLLYTIEIPITW